MNKIYVRFPGDNDFITTVRAFVQAIAPRILLGDWGNITKEEVADLFNAHSFSLYCLHQASSAIKPNEHIRSYLHIEEKDVYFGEEHESFTNYNHDGCLAYLTNDDIVYAVM